MLTELLYVRGKLLQPTNTGITPGASTILGDLPIEILPESGRGYGTVAAILLRKDTVWTWDENNSKAFQELKRLIATAPVLCLYDPSLPVTISVDASPNDWGLSYFKTDSQWSTPQER